MVRKTCAKHAESDSKNRLAESHIRMLTPGPHLRYLHPSQSARKDLRSWTSRATSYVRAHDLLDTGRAPELLRRLYLLEQLYLFPLELRQVRLGLVERAGWGQWKTTFAIGITR